MSRDRTRTREHSDDAAEFDVGLRTDVGDSGAETGEGGGLRERAGARAARLFSPRLFLLALALVVVGLLAGNSLVPLPGAGLLGVFLATFCVGLVFEERRYAEGAAAGGLAVGASFFLDYAVLAVLGGLGVSVGLLGGALGAVVGVAGVYFGRDLRRGLTSEVA
jgi:hypothetical protein